VGDGRRTEEGKTDLRDVQEGRSFPAVERQWIRQMLFVCDGFQRPDARKICRLPFL